MVCEQDGAELLGDRALMDRVLVEKCLKLAPSEIKIFPQDSAEPHVLADDRVHFVAGSVVPYIYDEQVQGLREPSANDLVEHVKVLNHC